MSFKKILIPVDGSPVSLHAVRVGLDLARALNARVATVFAVEPSMGDSGEVRLSDEQMAAAAGEDDREVMATVRRDTGLPEDAEHFVHVGQAADVVDRTARDWPADLIVMGSHGRGGLGRALLGSVSETAVRHAPCAVLIVRGAE